MSETVNEQPNEQPAEQPAEGPDGQPDGQPGGQPEEFAADIEFEEDHPESAKDGAFIVDLDGFEG
ncbi:MAG: hypothetical protein RIB59_09010, partial [Rhodospirillales bacterium]